MHSICWAVVPVCIKLTQVTLGVEVASVYASLLLYSEDVSKYCVGLDCNL